MTIFTLLPIAARNLLAGGLFFVTVGLLAVLLFQFLTHARLWRSIVNTILFLIFTGFTAYVMASATKPEIYPLSIAWVWLLIIAVIVLCYDVFAITTEYGRNKKQLSSASVKETLDNLASGICFADKSGRIILINVAMSKLTSALIGSYPQMLWELLSSLEQPSAESRRRKAGRFSVPFSRWKGMAVQYGISPRRRIKRIYANNCAGRDRDLRNDRKTEKRGIVRSAKEGVESSSDLHFGLCAILRRGHVKSFFEDMVEMRERRKTYFATDFQSRQISELQLLLRMKKFYVQHIFVDSPIGVFFKEESQSRITERSHFCDILGGK